LSLEERRRAVERCVPLIQHRRKALEHVRNAWGDLECDRHLVDRCPAGKRAMTSLNATLNVATSAPRSSWPCRNVAINSSCSCLLIDFSL